jgi:uncharacterized protein (TIRG00374 family)
VAVREAVTLGRWKLLLLLAKVAFSVGLFVFLFRRIPPGAFLEAVRVDHPEYLVAALTAFFGSNLLASYQWGRLLRAAGIRLSFLRVCAYYHVGLFFNNFLPANIGGDIARVVDAGRHGSGRTTALSTVLMDRVLGTVALGGLALVTSWPAVTAFHLHWIYLLLVGFFLAGLGLLWAAVFPDWMLRLERLLAALGLGGLQPRLEELSTRMAGYRDHRGALARLLLVALATQLTRVTVHVLVARALGLTIPLHYFFLFVPLLAVIVSLPISFNGIGVREGAGVVLFGLVGVDRAHAFSLQFMTYLVAVSVSLLGGLVFLMRLPGRRRQASAGAAGGGR